MQTPSCGVTSAASILTSFATANQSVVSLSRSLFDWGSPAVSCTLARSGGWWRRPCRTNALLGCFKRFLIQLTSSGRMRYRLSPPQTPTMRPTVSVSTHGTGLIDIASAGGYWKGGVWPPTNYMSHIVFMLDHFHERFVQGSARVECVWVRGGGVPDRNEPLLQHHRHFQQDGHLLGELCPRVSSPRQVGPCHLPLPLILFRLRVSKPDFVGWSGLGPIAVFLEYIIGLR